MKKYYTLNVAGLTRELPLCRVNDNLNIAAFVIFGDVELTEKCAGALLEKAPEFDIMITAESKGIPLVHEMARQAGRNDYIVARKAPKLYMTNVFTVKTNSITTEAEQILCVSDTDVELMRGRRVLIVDDVISTGGSLASLEQLVKEAGGIIAGKMAILAEGDAIERGDLIALEKLPLFDGECNQIE